MRSLFLAFIFLSATAQAADVKLSQLPLGIAASTGSSDSFPYVDATAGVTKRLTLSDLKNLPGLASTYAPLASPTFTGVLTAPSLVGVLTGNVTGNLTGNVTGDLTGDVNGNVIGDLTGDVTGNVTGNVTGMASGNTSYTPNNHGVVASSATNAMTVIAPNASTNYPLISGGLSADPSWGVLGIAGGGTGQTTANAALNALLPSQASNANKVLTTNGTDASWTTASGGGGSKNYLGTVNNINGNGNFELGDTSKWSLGTVALTNNFPSGTPTFGSGASGNLALSAVSSGQLSGLYSLSYASSAATTAGDFVASDAFTIDLSDQAQVLGFSFKYKAVTNPTNGNFSGSSSNSFGVAIYDVTNSAFIQPAGVYNLVQNSGVGTATGTFQTPSNSTQFRVLVYNANASSGAITMYFDDFTVGPQVTSSGASMSDWISWVPTGSWSNTTYTGLRRVVGDTEQYQVKLVLSGVPTSTALTINLPSGRTIDTNKWLLQHKGTPFGEIEARDTGTAGYSGFVTYNDTTSVAVLARAVSGTDVVSTAPGDAVTQANPFTFGASDEIYMSFSVPIAGLSSNTVQSSDTDTRVISFRARKNSGSQTSSGSYQDVASWAETNFDDAGAFNSTSGIYTVTTPGTFHIHGVIGVAANATGVRAVQVQKNGSGSECTSSVIPNASVASLVPYTCLVKCIAGDTLRVRLYQNSGGSLAYSTNLDENTINVYRLSGPATIQATESVNARYSTTAGQSIPTSSNTTVVFGTKEYDSHSAMNSSTGIYTCPISGKYRMTASLSYTANATGFRGIRAAKNGASVGYITLIPTSSASSGTILNGSFTQQCNAGETINIYAIHNVGSALTLSTNVGENWITIERVGN